MQTKQLWLLTLASRAYDHCHMAMERCAPEVPQHVLYKCVKGSLISLYYIILHITLHYIKFMQLCPPELLQRAVTLRLGDVSVQGYRRVHLAHVLAHLIRAQLLVQEDRQDGRGLKQERQKQLQKQ